MLTVAEAQDAILGELPTFGTEDVAIDQVLGRVLRQSIVAERDQPPFDRVMMDGIAIRHADFVSGRREFEIQATQQAGDAIETLDAGQCIEIMTGAALPVDADCIVPVERIETRAGVAVIEADYSAEARQFIHPKGSDHLAGSELLANGTRVTPMDVAVIASASRPSVAVSENPTIRVISTGNELVAAGEPIAAQQIRLSNGPAVVAMLEQHGFDNCAHDHLVDDPALLRQRLAAHLDEASVLVLSGGVSMGKADFVPAVLSELGVRVVFHKISQRPGKPMWFGIGPQDQLVFALPGNPVSTLVCCRQYVVPALYRASGMPAGKPEFASLAQPVTFRPNLTCFMPARLVSNAAGTVLALPVPTNTSGDFASLAGTDGYVELAREQNEFPVGTAVPLHRWRL